MPTVELPTLVPLQVGKVPARKEVSHPDWLKGNEKCLENHPFKKGAFAVSFLIEGRSESCEETIIVSNFSRQKSKILIQPSTKLHYNAIIHMSVVSLRCTYFLQCDNREFLSVWGTWYTATNSKPWVLWVDHLWNGGPLFQAHAVLEATSPASPLAEETRENKTAKRWGWKREMDGNGKNWC